MARKDSADIDLPISIGIASALLSSPGPKLRLERVRRWYFLGWGIFTLLTIAAIFWLGGKSEMLRECCPPPPGGVRRAFSLSRCQMGISSGLYAGFKVPKKK